MIILALETSGNICSVAIDTPNFYGEYTVRGNNLHDQFLAEFTRRIIVDAGINADEIDYIALSSGPGSFTGLRIGAALAKGLAFGSNTKIIPVPTMNSYAFSAIDFLNVILIENVYVLIPAQKNNYFMQMFDSQGLPISEIKLITLAEANELKKTNFIIGPELKEITANDVLTLAKLNLKTAVSTDLFEPDYHMDFVPNTDHKELNI